MRQRDPYMSYRYSGRNSHVTFEEASDLFTYNGIARKIIKAPADEAVRAGFELRDGTTPLLQDADIQSVLEDLRVQEVFSTALAWDRLYGGAAILMLVNDGGTLEGADQGSGRLGSVRAARDTSSRKLLLRRSV